MSKLSNAIRTKQGSITKSPKEVPLVSIKCVENIDTIPYTPYRHYRIGFEIFSDAKVPDANAIALAFAMEQCSRAITEEVFGEFRNPLYAIKLALINYDTDKAMMLVDEILAQMFDFKAPP